MPVVEVPVPTTLLHLEWENELPQLMDMDVFQFLVLMPPLACRLPCPKEHAPCPQHALFARDIPQAGMPGTGHSSRTHAPTQLPMVACLQEAFLVASA